MIRKLLKDCFTGPDGETIALGRVYSLPTLIAGLAVPLIAVWKGQPVDLASLGVMLGGLGGAIMLLVTGTNPTEPKG